jgi:hypothetical protein
MKDPNILRQPLTPEEQARESSYEHEGLIGKQRKLLRLAVSGLTRVPGAPEHVPPFGETVVTDETR